MVKKKAKAKKRSAQVVLPLKMSKLIEICLCDMRRVEAMPEKFVVDMDDWFCPEDVTCETSNGVVIAEHKICSVCAAGSVMAMSLRKAGYHHDDLTPENFPKNTRQLNAIDALRRGDVLGAAYDLELVERQIPEWCYTDALSPAESRYQKLCTTVPDYDREKPKTFHRAMEKLQRKLEKDGL